MDAAAVQAALELSPSQCALPARLRADYQLLLTPRRSRVLLLVRALRVPSFVGRGVDEAATQRPSSYCTKLHTAECAPMRLEPTGAY